MSDDSKTCPKCTSPYGYKDQSLWVCPECSHEWSDEALASEEAKPVEKFLDANGVQLQSGDTVRVVKDLKSVAVLLNQGRK